MGHVNGLSESNEQIDTPQQSSRSIHHLAAFPTVSLQDYDLVSIEHHIGTPTSPIQSGSKSQLVSKQPSLHYSTPRAPNTLISLDSQPTSSTTLQVCETNFSIPEDMSRANTTYNMKLAKALFTMFGHSEKLAKLDELHHNFKQSTSSACHRAFDQHQQLLDEFQTVALRRRSELEKKIKTSAIVINKETYEDYRFVVSLLRS